MDVESNKNKTLELTTEEYESLQELILHSRAGGHDSYKLLAEKLPKELIDSTNERYGDEITDIIAKFNLEIKQDISIDVISKVLLLLQDGLSLKHTFVNWLKDLECSPAVLLGVFDQLYKPKATSNFRSRVLIIRAILSREIILDEARLSAMSKYLKTKADTILFLDVTDKSIVKINNDVKIITNILKIDPVWAIAIADRSVLPYLVSVCKNAYAKNILQRRMNTHPENFFNRQAGEAYLKKW